MGVKPNPIKNDGTTITSPQWVSNISQIGVSAFVNDKNYISNASINIGNVVYSGNNISLLKNDANFVSNNTNYNLSVGTITSWFNTVSYPGNYDFRQETTQVGFATGSYTVVDKIYNGNILTTSIYKGNACMGIQCVPSYTLDVNGTIRANAIIYGNTSLQSAISTINSNLTTLSNSLSNCYSYVSSQVATLSNTLITLSGNTTIQISNIKAQLINVVYVGNNISLFANDKAYQNVSQVSLSITSALSNVVYQANIANVVYRNSNVSLLVNDARYITTANLSSNIVYYANLYSTDVRKLSNTSNIIYLGSNVSQLYNDSLYVSQGEHTISVGDALLSGNLVYATKRLQVGNIILEEGMVNGTNGFKILSDLWSGAELAMSAGGLAMGAFGAFKSLFNNDGSIAQDLQQEIDDGISSGNTAITIDWSQLRNCPLGYTGTTLKKCGIQSDMYMGGSLYYDSSIVDISQNFYGSVKLNNTSSGVKMIDGQSRTAYFTDVKASGNVKTDDLRSYTSGTPIYCFNDLNGQGNISSQLYISATKDISASGNTFTTNLTATQTVSGNLLRASAITGISGGKTTLYTDVDTTGNVRSFTNQIVYGVLTANSLAVSYDANFGSNIYTNNLSFTGNIFYNSSIVQFSQFTGNNKQISYGGNITTTGNIIANNYFLGTQNLYSYIQSVSNVSNIWIQTNGNAKPVSNSIVSNTLYVSEILTTNSNNELIIRAAQTRFVGAVLIDPAELTIEGNLFLWGSVVAGNNFVCSKDTLITGQCAIVSNLYIQSDIDIRGNLNSLDENMWIAANNMSLIGNVSVSRNLSSGTLQASSTITPAGQGAYISWNRGSSPIGNGQTSFLNQQGLGTGGFEWVCYNSVGSYMSVPMYLYPNGTLVVDKLSANTTTVSGGLNAGNQSFSSLVNPTTSGINLRGTMNNATTGAHILAYTSQDTYPLMEYFHWQHDNNGIMFDVYYGGGGWTSTSNTTNYMIYKYNGLLQFQYTTAATQGTVVSPSTSMCINAANVGIQTQYPAYPLDVNGTMRATTGIFTTSITLPNSSTFTGKTSQLNNDAGFLSSVGSGYIANNVSYNISCGTVNATSTTVSSLTNSGGLYMGGASGMIMNMTVNMTGNRQLWFYDSGAPTNSTTAATRINTSSTANVGYIGAVSTDGTTQMPLVVGDGIVIINTLNLPNAYRFTGKTSQLNNDAGFLTSVSSTSIPGINSTGSVAINTTSASYNLDIYGSARIYNAGADAVQIISCNNGTNYSIFQLKTNSSAYTGQIFETNTGVMVIDNGGRNIGINTPSPSYPLDVNGSMRATGTITQSFTRTFSTTTNGVGTIASYTNSGGSGTFSFDIDVITSGGGLTMTAKYKIAGGYHSTTGAWKRCNPLGFQNLNTDAYELQMNATYGTTTFRLVHSTPTLASTPTINIITSYSQADPPTITNLTASAETTDANWATYGFMATSVLTQQGGNVGIATTSPGTTLDVNGVIRGTGYIFPLGSWLTSTDGKNRFYFGATGKTYYASASGDHEWRIDSTGATMGMTLTATSGALYTLGNGQFNNCKVGDAGFGGNYTAFGHSTMFGTNAYALLSDNVGGTYLNAGSGQPIYFRISNGDVGRWTSTGLGVGTTSPAYPLDVGGDIQTSGYFRMSGTAPAIFGQSNTIGLYSSGITLSSIGLIYLTSVNGIIGTGKSAWSGPMTVGSGSTQTTYPLKVVGNTFTTGAFVGSTDPTGLVNYCSNSLTLTGTNGSITGGAHIQGFTNTDAYSTFQLLNWSHDNMCLGFDSQFNGSNWVSTYSSAPSYQIYKIGGILAFNYAPTTTRATTITNTTTMCINQNKVGISTITPAYSLDVNGNCRITNGFTSSAFSGVGVASPAYWMDVQGTSIQTQLFNVGYGTPYSVLTVRGSNVGILNSIPGYPLTVSSTASNTVAGGYFMNAASSTIVGWTTSSQPISIFSTGSILTQNYFLASSDSRLKKNITPRDTAKDLELLCQIPLKSFDFIDRKTHSTDEQIVGVVAQDIQEVLPTLVKEHIGYIPNYYEIRDIVERGEGYFEIVGEFNEPDGTKIQCYYPDGDVEVELLCVVKDGAALLGQRPHKKLTHDKGTLNISKLFVYGTEKNDVLSVNYNGLHNLNLSATQELARIIRSQDFVIQKLADKVSSLSEELKNLTIIVNDLRDRPR